MWAALGEWSDVDPTRLDDRQATLNKTNAFRKLHAHSARHSICASTETLHSPSQDFPRLDRIEPVAFL